MALSIPPKMAYFRGRPTDVEAAMKTEMKNALLYKLTGQQNPHVVNFRKLRPSLIAFPQPIDVLMGKKRGKRNGRSYLDIVKHSTNYRINKAP